MRRTGALALFVCLLVSGCAARESTASDDEEGPQGAGSNENQDSLPEALQYEPGLVDAAGKKVAPEQVATACTTSFNSTVLLDPSANFTGEPHDHDLWEGQTSKVIYDGVPHVGGASWVDLPGVVVLQGAGRADFKLEWDQRPGDWDWRRLELDLPGMYAPGSQRFDFTLNFTESGQTHSVAFNAFSNDAPHAGFSDWSLRMPRITPIDDEVPNDHAGTWGHAASVPDGFQPPAVRLTWTIHRTYDCLPLDPPHYDLWQGSSVVEVLATTHECIRQIDEPAYNPQCSIPAVAYTGMVPSETTIVEVNLTWDNEKPDPVKLGMEYLGGDQKDTTSAQWKRVDAATKEDDHRVYRIPVDPAQVDSLYENKTAWRFRVFFDELGHDAVDDTGDFEGTVTWKVTAYRAGSEPT